MGIPERHPDIEPVEQRKYAECRIQSVHVRHGTNPGLITCRGNAMATRCQRVVSNYVRLGPAALRIGSPRTNHCVGGEAVSGIA